MGKGTSAQVHRDAVRNPRLEELRVLMYGSEGVANVSGSEAERPALGCWSDFQERRSSPELHLTELGTYCTWTAPNPEGNSTSSSVDQPKDNAETLARPLLH